MVFVMKFYSKSTLNREHVEMFCNSLKSMFHYRAKIDKLFLAVPLKNDLELICILRIGSILAFGAFVS